MLKVDENYLVVLRSAIYPIVIDRLLSYPQSYTRNIRPNSFSCVSVVVRLPCMNRILLVENTSYFVCLLSFYFSFYHFQISSSVMIWKRRREVVMKSVVYLKQKRLVKKSPKGLSNDRNKKGRDKVLIIRYYYL